MIDTGQLWALLRLRWTLVRSPGRRRTFAVTLMCLPGLVAAVYVCAATLSAGQGGIEVRVLLPTLLAAFAIFSFATPLIAGGGAALFPPEDLVAFPVRSDTFAWMALLLTPLNITWIMQVVAIVGATGYAVAGTGRELSILPSLLLWLALWTVLGSALAWLVVGVRQRRVGRIATWLVGAAVAGATLGLALANAVVPFLDSLPTTRVAARMILVPGRQWAELVVLVALTLVVALAVLPRCTRWAMSRVRDAAGGSHVHRRLAAAPTTWSLVRKDCLAAWRTAPLRRGAITLTLLPVVLAAFSDVSWVGLVLVPALVAAGAVLLYGINAFCLDAGGTVWLATLPVDPRRVLWAKALSLTLVTAGPALLAVAVGAFAIAAAPTAVELTAVLGAAAAGVLVSVARGLRLSVTRPYKADLLGPRDTPAPPGAMALYSLDLAGRGILTALWFTVTLLGGVWYGPLIGFIPVALLTAASLSGTARRWSDPAVRARVVTAVAYG